MINKKITREELKKWIFDNLYTKNRKQLAPARANRQWFYKRDLIFYYKAIISFTNFLDIESPIKERVKYILSDIYEKQLCECGKPIKYNTKGLMFCSKKCFYISEKVKTKRKNTNIKKYGYSCSLNNNEIQNKSKKTILKKYGVKHTFQAKCVKNKIEETMKKRHGIINPGQKHVSKETIEKINNKEWLHNEYYTKKKSSYLIAKEIKTTPRTVCLHLKKLGIKIKENVYQSSAEKEIINFIPKNIKTNHGDNNVIYPYQIDVYIPEYKLGIEYDGIFYHSYYKLETEKEKKYHLNKTLRAQKKEVKLLHIFENEWLDIEKQKIWKSIINEYLNLNKILKNIKVKQVINKKNIKYFIEKNSLKNYKQSNIFLALYNEDAIISVLTLLKLNNSIYEITNFCTKNFISNKNCFNLLIKYFIDKYNPKIITTLLDYRYENEKIYDINNFKYIENTYPDFFYIKNNKFYDKNLLSSEEEAFNNNYRRIWNCGYLKYEWRKDNG